jgi:hypothetical protein
MDGGMVLGARPEWAAGAGGEAGAGAARHGAGCVAGRRVLALRRRWGLRGWCSGWGSEATVLAARPAV